MSVFEKDDHDLEGEEEARLSRHLVRGGAKASPKAPSKYFFFLSLLPLLFPTASIFSFLPSPPPPCQFIALVI